MVDRKSAAFFSSLTMSLALINWLSLSVYYVQLSFSSINSPIFPNSDILVARYVITLIVQNVYYEKQRVTESNVYCDYRLNI